MQLVIVDPHSNAGGQPRPSDEPDEAGGEKWGYEWRSYALGLEEELTETKDTLDELQDASDEVEAELYAQLEEAKGQVEELKKKNSALESTLASNNTPANASVRALQSFNSSSSLMSSRSGTSSSSSREMNDLRATVLSLREQVASLEASLAEEKARTVSLENDLEESSIANRRTEAALNATKEELDGAREEATIANTLLEEATSDAQTDSRRLLESLSEARDEIAVLKTQLELSRQPQQVPTSSISNGSGKHSTPRGTGTKTTTTSTLSSSSSFLATTPRKTSGATSRPSSSPIVEGGKVVHDGVVAVFGGAPRSLKAEMDSVASSEGLVAKSPIHSPPSTASQDSVKFKWRPATPDSK